ncbi:FAD-dependent oxidoreductase [Brevibacillus panacihumi W25]|uniref:Pyridine nucleotide-disulfide oxidoreductase domain-containing protein 2 n=1 Tax=Brevibacillus panacihumi W25 TaxID=1408254 RepID=V6MBN3_9BACL|nr:NAD(P)/FAD-dependent oxidoreductase [Brevibacillus panacihumi]EST55627.1 FAD-dependent oxidoreductase [Brevibacillus panacihumi W25]
MKRFDSVIIGSGINSLTAAALLAKKGQKVLVLERSAWIGGCIRTDEITLTGFKHDVFSGWHPLFVTGPAYGELKDDLHQNGLEYVNTDVPTGVILPDQRSAVLYNNRQKNTEAFNRLMPGDGDRYQEAMKYFEANSEMIFTMFGNEPMSWAAIQSVLRSLRSKGVAEFTRHVGSMVAPTRKWLDLHFQSDAIKALFAPWILHTGVGPDDAAGSIMAQLIVFTLEAASMPIPKGGGTELVKAIMKVVIDNGGEFITNAQVEQILVENGRVKGVQTQDKSEYLAQYVLANVTPQQLYEKLLAPEWVPQQVRKDARNYQYGRADMQIHYALDRPLDWKDEELKRAAIIHLTSGVNGVSQSVTEAVNGLLPREGTIVLGQHTAYDPSRAPEGKHTLWIQLQEMPRNLAGDALGEIDTTGGYTDQVVQAYADRIEERISRHVPQFKESILKRVVISPVELERYNPNLVGGDPYSGSSSVDQFLFFRPGTGYKRHETPIRNLYHIGASTHPGAGLGGTSGYLAVKAMKG